MSRPPPTRGEIVVYSARDGDVHVEVRLEHDTVWLSQAQMAQLFGRDQSVIARHVGNVFKEGELTRESNMQKVHIATSDRPLTLYSLDAIISVGYRVKSRRGTQFRIWATRTLRDHLLRGYTLNERRLREKGVREIEQAVGLMTATLAKNALVTDEGRAVLDVIQRYSGTWRLLLEYDEDRLSEKPARAAKPAREPTLEATRRVIGELRRALADRGQASALFARERTDHLGAILAALRQTFNRKPLYPNAQARAAHLLYFVIKDHPFADGNKRIGTLLFLDYLRLCSSTTCDATGSCCGATEVHGSLTTRWLRSHF